MRTKAEDKVVLEFKKKIDTKEFNELILKIRRNLKIPISGVEPNDNDQKRLWDVLWKPTALNNDPSSRRNLIYTCNQELKKLKKFFVLENQFYKQILRLYIFYNRFLFNELAEQAPYYSSKTLCEIEDAKIHLEEILPTDHFREELSEALNDNKLSLPEDDYLAKFYLVQLREKLEEYPIVIRIHPEAGQNVIIDFIKKNWKYIEAMQGQYTDKNQPSLKHGKTKVNPLVQKRNKLIIDSREKSAKEINALLRDEGIEPLDYAYISKIIRDSDKEKKCDTD